MVQCTTSVFLSAPTIKQWLARKLERLVEGGCVVKHICHFIGAPAARTTVFKDWFGNAWTVRLPIVTGTSFVDNESLVSLSSSKDSFLNASKIP